MKKKSVVSFALWGNHPMYFYGAIKNVLQSRQHYRGWEIRFYVPKNLYKNDSFRLALSALGVSVNEFPLSKKGYDYLYYRLYPVFDPEVKRVVFRDCDSRITEREMNCIREWTASKYPVHSIRDHRMHTAPLMGGMWGCWTEPLLELIPDFEEALFKRMESIRNGVAEDSVRLGRMHYSDQVWLRDFVWPKVKEHTIAHDNWKRFTGVELPIKEPMKSKWDFIGQAYTIEEKPVWNP
jgi:hypothetical protein